LSVDPVLRRRRLETVGEARFYRPDGRPLPQAPPAPALPATAGGPVDTLVSRLTSRGVAVDARETLPDWQGESVDPSQGRRTDYIAAASRRDRAR
jgi:hypothetical protein